MSIWEIVAVVGTELMMVFTSISAGITWDAHNKANQTADDARASADVAQNASDRANELRESALNSSRQRYEHEYVPKVIVRVGGRTDLPANPPKRECLGHRGHGNRMQDSTSTSPISPTPTTTTTSSTSSLPEPTGTPITRSMTAAGQMNGPTSARTTHTIPTSMSTTGIST